ncbi:hypothetical protein FOZ60_012379 [Perkinsus olseni]|uniref:WW domain-containing protein n=1 Tax=Perkinsus olseni TaxID=32597 RepID=A0A7J6PAT7_PEROL|nr:hypothetical protein FOZ60_012379 [Perkinsus olseni]
MAAAVTSASKVPAGVLGKIVGLSTGKTQQVPEEPTEQEVEDYAVWLGLDKVKDRDLFWIARQALRTPIPQPWVQCQTASGDVFFHNTKTKESVWDHPYDQYYQQAVEQYKSGKSSREELSARVSQSWLFSTTDQRSSAQVSPESIKGKGGSSINRSTTDHSPSRIVPDIELPDEPVVEAAGLMSSQVLVSGGIHGDELDGGDLATEISEGAKVDNLLEEVHPGGDGSGDATEQDTSRRLFEPPPRSMEAAQAELAELKLKLEEMEKERAKAEGDLRNFELRREKMQVDYDAAVVSLTSMREARDAAVAELEEAKEELEKEKEARQKAEAQLTAQAASNRIVIGELTEQLEEAQSKSEYMDGFIATQTGEIEMLRERLRDGREKVRVLAEEDVAQRKLLVEKDTEVVNLNRTLATLRQQLHVESKRSTFSKLCGRAPKDMADTIVYQDPDASVDAPEQNEIFEELLNRVLSQPPSMTDKPS